MTEGCSHKDLLGPTAEMMEDGDWYQSCNDCGQVIHRYLINIQTTIEVKAPSANEAHSMVDTSGNVANQLGWAFAGQAGTLSLVSRYEASLTRQLHRVLDDLQRAEQDRHHDREDAASVLRAV